MKNPIITPLLAIALCVLVFAPMALLQTTAWTGMAVSYSWRSGSLSQGLSETFDGAHPCALCKVVQESRKPENGLASGTAAAAFGAGLGVLLALGIRRLDRRFSGSASVLYPIPQVCAFSEPLTAGR